MSRLAMVALVVFVCAAVAAPTVGSAQQTGVAAEIHQGNCDEVGDVVAPLVEATIPQGEPRGNAAAVPAANSFTTVPISLEALTASDHVIVVPFPAGAELVACGEIGGTLTEAGALIVGLAPRGETEISGIAYLSPGTDPAQTTISLFVSGEDLKSFLDTTFLPAPVIAQEDVSTFDEVLAARESADSLAGPLAGTLVQRGGQGAGVTTENFSATVTFVNPEEQTETPWDVGLVFHQNLEQTAGQAVTVSSDGFWYYQDGVTGALQVAPQTSFDATPGATNTLDLVVEGPTALFALNGEILARIDLPAATASDVFVTTGFFAENIVEGREMVYSDFEVWEGPPASQQAAIPAVAAAQDDASRFAAALAARDSAVSLARPVAATIPDHQGAFLLKGAGITVTDFSTTVTFVNPAEQTETPWDVGFAFHQTGDIFQSIYVDSDGFWYYQGTRSGFTPTFDATPGAKNTLDLVVDGTTALFGVNGAFVGSIDLPPASTSDVYVGTGFFEGHDVEGREITYRAWEVWG